MLALDRALLAWLRRHHVPLDAFVIAAGGAFVFALSMTVSTYQQFYLSSRGWLPGAAVGVALLVGMGAAVLARRGEAGGAGADRGIALLARVALVSGVLLLQLAPMQISA